MKTHLIEVTNDGFNYGKFMIQHFDDAENNYVSQLPGNEGRLLRTSCGWDVRNIWVLDLQTGEGARFSPRGYAKADLQKHAIWVCPMYEPFLEWLYKQDVSDITKLPAYVDLKDAPAAVYGYRRPGPSISEKEK